MHTRAAPLDVFLRGFVFGQVLFGCLASMIAAPLREDPPSPGWAPLPVPAQQLEGSLAREGVLHARFNQPFKP